MEEVNSYVSHAVALLVGLVPYVAQEARSWHDRVTKRRAERDFLNSLGIADVPPDIFEDIACCLPHVEDGSSSKTQHDGSKARQHQDDFEIRRIAIEEIKDSVQKCRSEVIVLYGPSETGKNTIIKYALQQAQKCDGVRFLSPRDGRLKRLGMKMRGDVVVRVHEIRRRGRHIDRICEDVMTWLDHCTFVSGKTLDVFCMDFDNPFSSETMRIVLERVDNLRDKCQRARRHVIFLLECISDSSDVRGEDGAKKFKIGSLERDDCEAFLQELTDQDTRTSIDLLRRKFPDSKCFNKWLFERTNGRIGRLAALLDKGAQRRDKLQARVERFCMAWREDFQALVGSDEVPERFLSAVYLLAAIGRKLPTGAFIDARELCRLLSRDSTKFRFEQWRTVLRTAFFFGNVNFSRLRREDFHFSNTPFWDAFLAGCGTSRSIEFTDDLCVSISRALMSPLLKPHVDRMAWMIAESAARFEVENSDAVDNRDGSGDFDNLFALENGARSLQHTFLGVPEFATLLGVAYARVAAARCWRRIGVVEDSDIAEICSNITEIFSGEFLNLAIAVEVAPVLLNVCDNPLDWFGGNDWWRRIPDKADPDDLMLLLSYLSSSLARHNRFFVEPEQIIELVRNMRRMRRLAFLGIKPEIRQVVKMLWRVNSEVHLIESDAYRSGDMGGVPFSQSILKLFERCSLWLSTRYVHLIPAVSIELPFDFLLAENGAFFKNLDEVLKTCGDADYPYERCYMESVKIFVGSYVSAYDVSQHDEDEKNKGLLASIKNGAAWNVSYDASAILGMFGTLEAFRDWLWLAVGKLFEQSRLNMDDKLLTEEVDKLTKSVLKLQRYMSMRYRLICFQYLSRVFAEMGREWIDETSPVKREFACEFFITISSFCDFRNPSSVSGGSRASCYKCILEVCRNFLHCWDDTLASDWNSWRASFQYNSQVYFPTKQEIVDFIFNAEILAIEDTRLLRDWICRSVSECAYLDWRRAAQLLYRLAWSKDVPVYAQDGGGSLQSDFFDCITNIDSIEISQKEFWCALLALVRDCDQTSIAAAYRMLHRLVKNEGMLINEKNTMIYAYVTFSVGDKGGDVEWLLTKVKMPVRDAVTLGYLYRLAERLGDRDVGLRTALKDQVLNKVRMDMNNPRSGCEAKADIILMIFIAGVSFVEALSEKEKEVVQNYITDVRAKYKARYLPEISSIERMAACLLPEKRERLCLSVAEMLKGMNDVTVFPHVLLGDELVDLAVSNGSDAVLLKLLPDDVDFEFVDEEITVEPTDRARNHMTLNFVSHLNAAADTLRSLEPDAHVGIGLLASECTIINARHQLPSGVRMFLFQWQSVRKEFAEFFDVDDDVNDNKTKGKSDYV